MTRTRYFVAGSTIALLVGAPLAGPAAVSAAAISTPPAHEVGAALPLTLAQADVDCRGLTAEQCRQKRKQAQPGTQKPEAGQMQKPPPTGRAEQPPIEQPARGGQSQGAAAQNAPKPAETNGGNRQQNESATQPPQGEAQGQQPAQASPTGQATATQGRQRPAQPAQAQTGGNRQQNATANQQPQGPAQGQQATPQEQGAASQNGQAESNGSSQHARSAEAEQGRRIDEPASQPAEPQDAKVLDELGRRLIIQLGNQTVVRSSDRQRLSHNARNVFYEQLPHGRTRQTVVRPDGSKVVTIRDRYGDIVRRSRIDPSGHEYVLVDAEDSGDNGHWQDAGRNLPPIRQDLNAPDYVLNADDVHNPDRYYRFLEQPPIEPITRRYSIDDVKYSARVRDTLRRIDLDTINFATGSATIPADQVSELRALATAIDRILARNPTEMFLVEGYTDAVGSARANLALSDARAESVAEALTDDFGVPPENLVTQGYGEQFLKVDTQGPSRANRRVAIRRITPLVQSAGND